MHRFLTILVLLFSVESLLAANALDHSIRQNFMSARALGMGNAYIAMADDYNTLLMNPAGLSRLDTWQMNLSFELAAGADFQKIISQIQTSSKEGSSSISKTLQDLNGNEVYFRAVPASGFLVRPGWGIAVVPIDASINLAINNAILPAADINIYADTTLAFGLADDLKVGNGRFSLGVTGKLVHRVHMSETRNGTDFINGGGEIFTANDANEGLTVDADVGALWTPKLPHWGMWRFFKLAKPTFGAVVRNVVDSGFSTNLNTVSKTSGRPPNLYRTLDLGSRWEYPKMWIFKSRGLLDIRDIGHPNFSFMKGLHVGWELGWRMYDWWKGYYRLGINQGYLALGFSARLGIWNFDFASWGEEVGTFSTRKENRRFMMKFNIEI